MEPPATTGFPFFPTDGALVIDTTGVAHPDTGLTPGTTYFYSAFTYDEVPNFSPAATVQLVAP